MSHPFHLKNFLGENQPYYFIIIAKIFSLFPVVTSFFLTDWTWKPMHGNQANFHYLVAFLKTSHPTVSAKIDQTKNYIWTFFHNIYSSTIETSSTEWASLAGFEDGVLLCLYYFLCRSI